jgi:hypothetical protein
LGAAAGSHFLGTSGRRKGEAVFLKADKDRSDVLPRRISFLLIRVGPAGWRYKDWEGVVYPKPKPRGFDELVYLPRYFD